MGVIDHRQDAAQQLIAGYIPAPIVRGADERQPPSLADSKGVVMQLDKEAHMVTNSAIRGSSAPYRRQFLDPDGQ
jgi:hypothetical protein